MTAYDHAIYFFFKSHPLNKCQRKKKKMICLVVSVTCLFFKQYSFVFSDHSPGWPFSRDRLFLIQ